MENLRLECEECGILTSEFGSNYNQFSKPKPNKPKITKWSLQLQNYNLLIFEELKPSEIFIKHGTSYKLQHFRLSTLETESTTLELSKYNLPITDK